MPGGQTSWLKRQSSATQIDRFLISDDGAGIILQGPGLHVTKVPVGSRQLAQKLGIVPSILCQIVEIIERLLGQKPLSRRRVRHLF